MAQRSTRSNLSPKKLEAIDAELFAAVYDARRRARRRMLGDLPSAPADERALQLLRRERARQIGLDVVR